MTAVARIKARPAETTGGTGGAITILAAALGADATTVAIIGAASSFAPAAVTWLVERGGLRGLYRRLVYGDRAATSVHPPLTAAVKSKKTTARKTRPKSGDVIHHGSSITTIEDAGRPSVRDGKVAQLIDGDRAAKRLAAPGSD